MRIYSNEMVKFSLKVNSTSAVPLYLQVKKLMKKCILDERFEKGGRLPPIRRLSKESLLAPVTIEKAYRLLEKDGYVMRKKGDGYFVL
ncbi:GntR family transcriptional regulator [Paradesertivirga mongoliensis]|uniref:GntR family transcriptional regulator n=1 Tax=Paradesertivirga mongoliensis TaxID=2100740 RepID=A0ABW4ZKI2_9SPHI|nr:winged helix-turn-helix domain-containing protein [Pedobacter mongoliensis]